MLGMYSGVGRARSNANLAPSHCVACAPPALILNVCQWHITLPGESRLCKLRKYGSLALYLPQPFKSRLALMVLAWLPQPPVENRRTGRFVALLSLAVAQIWPGVGPAALPMAYLPDSPT
jgi:hypothetical protein